MKNLIVLLLIIFLCACTQVEEKTLSRLESIPADAVKMTPETDAAPPKTYSDEFLDPVPVEGINTAGAEDSVFIDGDNVYFFFTPDVDVPVEQQVTGGMTGIYVSEKTAEGWSEPEQVVLQDKGKLSLDGCEFVRGDRIWFCSAREGYTGVHWFTAEFKDSRWQDWKKADFDDISELHMIGDEMYYHADSGKGDLDIWLMRKNSEGWSDQINVAEVNSDRDEAWPYVTEDELWITRDFGLWRSKWMARVLSLSL